MTRSSSSSSKSSSSAYALRTRVARPLGSSVSRSETSSGNARSMVSCSSSSSSSTARTSTVSLKLFFSTPCADSEANAKMIRLLRRYVLQERGHQVRVSLYVRKCHDPDNLLAWTPTPSRPSSEAFPSSEPSPHCTSLRHGAAATLS